MGEFVEDYPERAARPISVREGTKLRDDCTAERHDEGWRSKTWSSVLNEFLNWYNGYRFSHLRMRDPEGELVRIPLQNSHQPVYGNRYYARVKALERTFLRDADDPHIVMLTLTASNRNEAGGWRCPADHLRDIVDPFRSNVRPALHRALSHVDRWEYAKVLEHHRSGYGHMHVAVFVDGPVQESDFHSVINTHIRHCDPAGMEAHDYYHPDSSVRPISVNEVDLNLESNPNRDDTAPIANVGSYIAEYIGSYGEELLERGIDELVFRACCWATGTQRVTFSPGANELIASNLDRRDDSREELPNVSLGWLPGTTAEDLEAAATDPDRSVVEFLEDPNPGWSLEGIGTVDPEGEVVHCIRDSQVVYNEICGAEQLDPPPRHPYEQPQRRSHQATL